MCADHVVIINAGKVALPPKKTLRKTYYRHTGYPGNMRVTSLKDAMRLKPTFAVQNAVKGMLEPTRLREQMLRRLHVYADEKHGYDAQKPQPISLRQS